MASTPSSTKRPIVALVGSNPSVKSPTNEAFHPETQSGRTIREWIKGIEGVEFIFLNVSSQPTENNKPINTKCMDQSAIRDLSQHTRQCDAIVAFGSRAAMVCRRLNRKLLEMPHPSGLNRKLNDKTYKDQKIKELHDFAMELSTNLKD